MNEGSFKDIKKFEADLWEAADNLRANSKLTSSDYFMPVLGIIFLRHAANRNVLHTLEVLWPSTHLLREFDEFLIPLFRQLSVLRREIKALCGARDLMLPRS